MPVLVAVVVHQQSRVCSPHRVDLQAVALETLSCRSPPEVAVAVARHVATAPVPGERQAATAI
jgi:hypothetical protein